MQGDWKAYTVPIWAGLMLGFIAGMVVLDYVGHTRPHPHPCSIGIQLFFCFLGRRGCHFPLWALPAQVPTFWTAVQSSVPGRCLCRPLCLSIQWPRIILSALQCHQSTRNGVGSLLLTRNTSICFPHTPLRGINLESSHFQPSSNETGMPFSLF